VLLNVRTAWQRLTDLFFARGVRETGAADKRLDDIRGVQAATLDIASSVYLCSAILLIHISGSLIIKSS
jgi:hypothetical protein